MSTPDSPTKALGDFVGGLRFEALPAPVVAQAANIILDTVGCVLGSWRDDAEKAEITSKVVGTFHAAPNATVWGGRGLKTDAAVAAMANGILANAADFDDTHKRALLHTGSVVVPPALALAEELKLSGRDIITAIVAGYETAVRVGMAVMPTHYRFWHSTATNGTFGAAATSARALGLDAAGARVALGLAGTQAAGLNTFFDSGDFTKSLHPGKASFNGVLSGRLAKAGASAPPTILEHPKGYLAAYSPEPKAGALVAGLGTKWEILENGFKFFPSILAGHSGIEATLDAVTSNNIAADAIRSITIETYATVKSHFSAKTVTTSMGARVSVPYCCAVAAIDRTLGQAQFAFDRVLRADVQAMLAVTDVVADAELNTLYPDKFPSRVTVTLKDGRKVTTRRDFPKGDPQSPLSDAEIAAKFMDNATARLSAADAREVITLVRGLPKLADIGPLMRLLGKG